MPFNIFGDWMTAPMGSIDAGGMPVTQPLSPAQPLSYGRVAQSAPGSTSPQPTPIPLPPPRPPLSLAPPNPPSVASMPPSAPTPGSASPFGGLGGLGAFANGIGSMFGNAINNHPLSLMALGAGIAQGGVGRGLAAATSAAETERNLQLQQLNYLHTYNALTGAGVPPQEAQAAIGNPSLMRAVAVRYLGARGQVGTLPARAASMRPAAAPVSAPSPSPGPAATAPASGPAASGNSPAVSELSANASNISTGPRTPMLPPNVPKDALYSPTRKIWRDPNGNFFDAAGRALP